VEAGEERCEAVDSLTVGRPVRDDEAPGDRDVPIPSKISRQEPTVAHLYVQPTQKPLRVGNFGLDLDNEQDLGGAMPGEEVDPTSVAVPIEARLDPHIPTPALQPSLPRGLQPAVLLV